MPVLVYSRDIEKAGLTGKEYRQMTITEFTTFPCSQYTQSERDPRITVHITVQRSYGSREGTTHTFWSRSEADRFRTLVERENRPHMSSHDIFRENFSEASAERMTSAEIGWLVTPPNEEPPTWTRRPAAMPA